MSELTEVESLKARLAQAEADRDFWHNVALEKRAKVKKWKARYFDAQANAATKEASLAYAEFSRDEMATFGAGA